MSAIEKRLTAAAFEALNTIGELAGKFGGENGKHAQVTLKAIGAIVSTIKDGFDRKIDPKEVLQKIEESLGQLEADITQNDKAADDALAAKFPPEHPLGTEATEATDGDSPAAIEREISENMRESMDGNQTD